MPVIDRASWGKLKHDHHLPSGGTLGIDVGRHIDSYWRFVEERPLVKFALENAAAADELQRGLQAYADKLDRVGSSRQRAAVLEALRPAIVEVQDTADDFRRYQPTPAVLQREVSRFRAQVQRLCQQSTAPTTIELQKFRQGTLRGFTAMSNRVAKDYPDVCLPAETAGYIMRLDGVLESLPEFASAFHRLMATQALYFIGVRLQTFSDAVLRDAVAQSLVANVNVGQVALAPMPKPAPLARRVTEARAPFRLVAWRSRESIAQVAAQVATGVGRKLSAAWHSVAHPQGSRVPSKV